MSSRISQSDLLFVLSETHSPFSCGTLASSCSSGNTEDVCWQRVFPPLVFISSLFVFLRGRQQVRLLNRSESVNKTDTPKQVVTAEGVSGD